MLLQMEQTVDQQHLELPVRVILNNRTLSVFSTSKYDNIYQSYDLPFLTATSGLARDRQRCLVVSDSRSQKHLTLCVMPQALQRGESIQSDRDTWMRDIALFRDQCGQEVKYSDAADSPFVAGLQQDLDHDVLDLADAEKETAKVGQLKVSTTEISNTLDTEVKWERLKRLELQDLEESMQKRLLDEVENEKKKEAACQKDEQKEESKRLVRKMASEQAEAKTEMVDSARKAILGSRSRESFQLKKDQLVAGRKLKAQKERLFLLKA